MTRPGHPRRKGEPTLGAWAPASWPWSPHQRRRSRSALVLYIDPERVEGWNYTLNPGWGTWLKRTENPDTGR